MYGSLETAARLRCWQWAGRINQQHTSMSKQFQVLSFGKITETNFTSSVFFPLTAKMNASAPLYSYLTPEEHILIRSSCVLLSEESKRLHEYVFWGKILGLHNDYYVVQSTTLNPYELPVTQYRYLPFLLHHSHVELLLLGRDFSFENLNSGCLCQSYFVFGIYWGGGG